MKIRSGILVIVLFLFIQPFTSFAQRKIASYVNYVETYSDLAINQMKKYRIPASITLAQGILESGAGTSSFVKESNNHFGIKCHRDWDGEKIYRTDDSPNECFRKYKKAIDSFEDHSLFLADKNRYSPLFQLNGKDYRAWAKGLQECGYATDKAYANKLIKLVEVYELYRYDTVVKNDKIKNPPSNKKQSSKKKSPPARKYRNTYISYGLLYTVAGRNDSYEAVAYDLEFKLKNLLKYNDVKQGHPLFEGEVIYLEKKMKKANERYSSHIIQVGESMHIISQKYGIQLPLLYKLNKIDGEYIPEEGDILRLR